MHPITKHLSDDYSENTGQLLQAMFPDSSITNTFTYGKVLNVIRDGLKLKLIPQGSMKNSDSDSEFNLLKPYFALVLGTKLSSNTKQAICAW